MGLLMVSKKWSFLKKDWIFFNDYCFVWFIGDVAASLVSGYQLSDWGQEGGDPCLPVAWSWLVCNSDPQPKIISV